VPCVANDLIAELLRGVRCHAGRLVKGLEDADAAKASLGLAHAYSRAKVKFNVNRVDNMIIQAIALADTLDKDVNTFAMRCREWYGWHFPEMAKLVPDNYTYARTAMVVRDKATLSEDKLPALEDVLGSPEAAKAVLDAARASMGQDVSPIDLVNIEAFARRVIALAEYRQSLGAYLGDKMHAVAPNLSALIGDTVGARLISHAGSLVNLAKYPASTVQILGAEKALFRALKTKGNTPKYGLIFHSSFIGRAKQKNKGRISRYLANKCSIASRIDCFSEVVTDVFGAKMKEQVEARLRFYEDGTACAKNITVMAAAAEEAGMGGAGGAAAAAPADKKAKKGKKEAKAEKEAKPEKKRKGKAEPEAAAPPAKKEKKAKKAKA
jgi:nucleolar protein 56